MLCVCAQLNDGSAYVLFVVVIQFVLFPNDPPSATDIVEEFCVLTFGGVLSGLLFGAVSVIWLRLVFNDERIEILITLISCYLCCWFCENILHEQHLEMSGILGVVFLGLVISKFKSAITPSAHLSMHHFWESVGIIHVIHYTRHYTRHTSLRCTSSKRIGSRPSARRRPGAKWSSRSGLRRLRTNRRATCSL